LTSPKQRPSVRQSENIQSLPTLDRPSPGRQRVPIGAAAGRLRKHADYQRVYQGSRKQFGKQMSYFFALRPLAGPDGLPLRGVSPDGARVGLTVGKPMGKAVDRNRIKRRMREIVRRQISLLQSPLDVVLHPRRSVIDLDFATLEREVASVFRAIEKAAQKQAAIPAPAMDRAAR
jgi:ribonuclease P protein component